MVSEQPYVADLEIGEDLRANTDMPLDAALLVGFVGLAAIVMEADNVLVADLLHTKTLRGLVQINERSSLFGGDGSQGAVDGSAAFAGGSAKYIADQAMRM